MEAIAADLGLVPNLAATAATSPALLAGFDGLRRAVASHQARPCAPRGGRAGARGRRRQPLRSGVPSENTAAATHQLAREVVIARDKVSDATITGATEAGLDIEAILEIVLEVTFAGLVGTIDNLANHVELDDFLAPRAWER